jgi:hypothetical protein
MAAIQKIDTLNPWKVVYKFYGYNFFHEATYSKSKINLNFVWSVENEVASIDQVFTDMFQFQGEKNTICNLPLELK